MENIPSNLKHLLLTIFSHSITSGIISWLKECCWIFVCVEMFRSVFEEEEEEKCIAFFAKLPLGVCHYFTADYYPNAIGYLSLCTFLEFTLGWLDCYTQFPKYGKTPNGPRVDPKWTLNEPWMNPEWILLGPWMDPEWTLNGSWMDPGWTLNGPWMDPERTLNGPWMDPKWTLNASWMDPKWTKMDPKWTLNGP